MSGGAQSGDVPRAGTPAVAVRRAEVDDLDALVPLFSAYRAFYHQPRDDDAARAFLAARLGARESVVFLALLDGRVVGFTQLYPGFSSVGLGRVWILNDLFVAPEGRRRGVGAALLERARRHAVETGARALTLETTTDNAPARALYEANGWKIDPLLHYEFRLDGEGAEHGGEADER